MESKEKKISKTVKRLFQPKAEQKKEESVSGCEQKLNPESKIRDFFNGLKGNSRLSLEKDKKQELSSWRRWRSLAPKKKKLAVGIITAMVAIGGIFAFLQTQVGATSYEWLQATWTGGADLVNFPRHGQDTPGVPKQNWTKYYSKDTQINMANDELKITQTDTNWTETDDASGFSSGTKSNTYSSGTGILLKKNNGVACTTAVTTDYECTTGNCDADFSSGNYCHATASNLKPRTDADRTLTNAEI